VSVFFFNVNQNAGKVLSPSPRCSLLGGRLFFFPAGQRPCYPRFHIWLDNPVSSQCASFLVISGGATCLFSFSVFVYGSPFCPHTPQATFRIVRRIFFAARSSETNLFFRESTDPFSFVSQLCLSFFLRTLPASPP